MRKFFVIWTIITVILLISCRKEDSTGIQTEVIDGITHVYNPANPLRGKIELEVKKTLEIDSLGVDSENPIFFHQVDHDEADNIYLADNNTVNIYKFSKSGKMISRFQKKGEGPGEFSRMGSLQIVNNHLWIAGNWPLKIAKYDLDGQFIEEWRFKYFRNFYLRTQVIEENRFLTVCYRPEAEDEAKRRKRVSALLDQQERVITTLFEHPKAGIWNLRIGTERPIQVAFTQPFIVPDIHHAYNDESGNVFLIFNRDYKIYVENLQGIPIHIIHREHQNTILTDKDKEEVIELIAGRMSEDIQESLKDQLPETFCAIRGIESLPNGYLAVKRILDASRVEIDIFDRQGKYVYMIKPSSEFPNLNHIRFSKKTIDLINHLEDRDVYKMYRIINLPEIYRHVETTTQ